MTEDKPTYDGNPAVKITTIIADDVTKISYRPLWRYIAGSVTSAILLQQMLYWWRKMNQKAFYKFTAPCNHEDYKEGDSWLEELGFKRAEFEGARNKIAKRIKTGDSKMDALEHYPVVYWNDCDRRTWYEFNEELLEECLQWLYSANAENLQQVANAGILQYISNAENLQYIDSTVDYQETTFTASTAAAPPQDETPPTPKPTKRYECEVCPPNKALCSLCGGTGQTDRSPAQQEQNAMTGLWAYLTCGAKDAQAFGMLAKYDQANCRTVAKEWRDNAVSLEEMREFVAWWKREQAWCKKPSIATAKRWWGCFQEWWHGDGTDERPGEKAFREWQAKQDEQGEDTEPVELDFDPQTKAREMLGVG
jgi:hypothetical protein